jgi:predicted aconitase with swiveling domain
MARVIQGETIIPGLAKGVALASSEPVSFWGGYDQVTGEIIDRRHPLSGQIAAGRMLVLPYTRGSSTSTAILLESVRAGVAPAGLITDRADVFLALASVVAAEMYETGFPMVAIDRKSFDSIQTGDIVEIDAMGRIHVESGEGELS